MAPIESIEKKEEAGEASLKDSSRIFRERIASRRKAEKRRYRGLKEGDFSFIKECLSEKEAMTEARRCLGCGDHPCLNACPIGMDVPKFISYITRGDFYMAGKTVFQHNPFALSCGILCPASELCQLPCKTYDSELGPIRIGRLQQFAATKLFETAVEAVRGYPLLPIPLAETKIACIGAGPASLSCATFLARIGFSNITVYEQSDVLGGTITHEIPEFRIPMSLLEREIQFVKDMGVSIEVGRKLGRDFSVEDLLSKRQINEDVGSDFCGYDAVFLGVGLMASKQIRQIDERFKNVLSSKDFLKAASTAVKMHMKVDTKGKGGNENENEGLPQLHGHVVVVGAGDVAVDCALTALRCGASRVSMVFRRAFTDIRCNEDEFENIRRAQVELIPNSMPIRIIRKGEIDTSVVNMNAGGGDIDGLEVEISDRLVPEGLSKNKVDVNVESLSYFGTGERRQIRCDYVITALGSSIDPEIAPLVKNVDELTLMSSVEGVFVGGDANGSSTMIVEAASDGRAAAWNIARYLAKKVGVVPPVQQELPFLTSLDIPHTDHEKKEKEKKKDPETHARDIEDLVADPKRRAKPVVRRVSHDHPVADPPVHGRKVQFKWNGEVVEGMEGEMISTSLIASGHDIFGYHVKDKTPQGIYCANGQCSACEVVADGVAVKSCMTPLKEGMEVRSGLPTPSILEKVPDSVLDPATIGPPREIDVLIIGGGPAGLSAALELGKLNIDVLLIDDKDALGGKLVLQTHKFFGSVADTRAGTRGYDIGKLLAEEVSELSSVKVELQTTAVGVFSDQVVGLQKIVDHTYELIKPRKLLVATGSREKMLPFQGNTLPGVYGAGAFQTILNRDFVRPAQRVLIVGGGNVGLITGYHALQADIEVVALVEALPECGGYKVHESKLRRLGVPILTRHSILAAHGTDHVTAATICQIDDKFQPIKGTEIEYDVDCILVAVGLSEVNEFYKKAKEWGMDVFSAGDAQAIAEASAAMVTGRIEGLNIARSLGHETEVDPKDLAEKAKTMRAPGGDIRERKQPVDEKGMRPIFHCYQEIPCDVCRNVCTHDLIYLEDGKISKIPQFAAENGVCEGCMDCVAGCSGLAITLFDSREDPDFPLVTMPFEIKTPDVAVGKNIPVMGENGNLIGNFMCMDIKRNEKFKTDLVVVQLPRDVAFDAVGVWQQDHHTKTGDSRPHKNDLEEKVKLEDSSYICRCERVTVSELKEAINMCGSTADVNQIKAITRLGMGACGGKTCGTTAARMLSQSGFDKNAVAPATDRPLVVEMPFGQLATAVTPLAPPSRFACDKYVSDRESNQYDVIIIGAGSIGVPIAMALASAGKNVLCVDQGPSPGTGDNKHAIGGMRATMSHPAKIITMLRSLEIFRTWKDVHGDNIEYQEGGYLFPCYREEDANMLKGLLPKQKKHGLNIGWADKEKMIKLIPGIVKEGLLGGMYSPEDGCASPMMAINAFYRKAVGDGATFKFRERVQAIMKDDDGKVTGIISRAVGVGGSSLSTSETTYYAPIVIDAAGAHGNEVLHSIGRELPIVADSHEAGITEPVDHLFDGMIIDLRPAPGSKNFYFYQNTHGQIIFCITPDPLIFGFDESETSQFLPQISKRILRLVPQLSSVSVRRVWRGLYNNTPDGLPLVGWDNHVPGLFHANGMGGHGFMLGPGLGEFITRMITNTTTEEDEICIDSYDPHREFTGAEALK